MQLYNNSLFNDISIFISLFSKTNCTNRKIWSSCQVVLHRHHRHSAITVEKFILLKPLIRPAAKRYPNTRVGKQEAHIRPSIRLTVRKCFTFRLLFQNHWVNFNQISHKVTFSEEIHVYENKWPCPFSRVVN